jgi:hypothetical protein
MVATTLMSLIDTGSTVSGFLSRITRSASLPGSSGPLQPSSPYSQAALIVIACRACSGVARSIRSRKPASLALSPRRPRPHSRQQRQE